MDSAIDSKNTGLGGDWNPLQWEELRIWALEVSETVAASNPNLLETEQRGFLHGGSFLATVVALNASRGPAGGWRRPWTDLVMSSVIQVETHAAGAGRETLDAVLGNVLGSRTQKDLQRVVSEMRERGFKTSQKRLLRKSEFIGWVQDLGRNHLGMSEQTLECVLGALNLSGPSTRILVEVGPGASKTQVLSDRSTGWKFRTGILPQGIREPWVRSECRVCLIDGMIETVASIDQLLQDANRARRPVLLVARGMSEEVVGTLLTNLLQGRLDICPVLIDPGEGSAVNTLVDLAVTTGGHVVSSLTGELLSQITLEGLATIPKVRVLPGHPGEVWVENPPAGPRVAVHVQTLRTRLLQECKSIPELSEWFESRLRNLTSDTVKILLPGGSMTPPEISSIKTQIDTLLREVKSCLTWGIIPSTSGLIPSEVATPTDARMPIAEPGRLRDAPSSPRTCLGSFLGWNASLSLLGALANVSGFLTEIPGVWEERLEESPEPETEF